MTKLVLKTRNFARWANDEGITDADLCIAIEEMECGLVDANLGGNVYKKRVALQGRGKRSGGRTIIATNLGDRWFFLYGFGKNDVENISPHRFVAIKATAKTLLEQHIEIITKLIAAKELEKVICPHSQETVC